FDFDDVERLVADCRRRFPGATLVFDAMPGWLTKASQRGKLGAPNHSQPPAWRWGMDRDKRRRLGGERLRIPRGRGLFFGYLAPLLRLGLLEIYRARRSRPPPTPRRGP